MRVHLACAVVGLLALAAPASSQEARVATAPMPPVLTQLVQPGSSFGGLRDRVLAIIRALDADGDGRLDEADIKLHEAVAFASARVGIVGYVMSADLDGDGVVTEAEFRARARYRVRDGHPQLREHTERRLAADIARFAAADIDRDGRVTWAEASASAASNPARVTPNTQQLRELLSSIGRENSFLTPDGVFAMVDGLVRLADTDGNGTISQEESVVFHRQVDQRRRQEYAVREAQRVVEARSVCGLPEPSAPAQLLLLSAQESDAISTATIGFQDSETGAGTIEVEPGDEPLYLVVTTFRPVIWRFTGAVGRVERAVFASTVTAPNRVEPHAVPLAGVVGLPAEKVVFVARPNCLRYFSDMPSAQAAMTMATVRRETGKEQVVVAARYAVSDIQIPSGRMRSVERAQRTMAIIREMAGAPGAITAANAAAVGALRQELDREYPGGMIEIDPRQTVSSVPVAKYEVLPAQAGLMQLLLRGSLTRGRSGEYHIREKIRFPAGLSGGNAARFLLLRGVPPPEGSAGHSCVISEETGEMLNGSRSNC
jgi:hypothetical protein